jgi:hypothetical protein
MQKTARKIPTPKPTKQTKDLPEPLVIGRRRYWRRGEIRCYLAEEAGKPAPAPLPDDEHLLQAKELRRMLGGVSDMWIFRHSRRPDCEQQSAAG